MKLAALALAALVAATSARALADDPIAAETTFANGRALMKEGKYAEACAAFELSLTLERAVGTYANLAACYEKLGRNASAWLAYREAAAAAQNAGQAERAAEARERAAKLEPTLCKLVVKPPQGAPPGAVVRRDGVKVDPALWGVGVPVDPGAHELDVSAGGAVVVKKIDVAAPAPGVACADVVVELPLPIAPPPSPLVVPGPRRAARAPIVVRPPPSSGKPRFVGVGLGVAGLVGLGVGGAFAAVAAAGKASADCSADGCSSTGRADMKSAGRSADVATVAFVTGGALLVAGVVVYLTAPPRAAPLTTALRF